MNRFLSLFRRRNGPAAALDQTALGLSTGLVGAGLIVIYSALAYGTGYGIEFETFIESSLPGYSLSPGGTIIGVIWMFSLGYIVASVWAWLYNQLINKD